VTQPAGIARRSRVCRRLYVCVVYARAYVCGCVRVGGSICDACLRVVRACNRSQSQLLSAAAGEGVRAAEGLAGRRCAGRQHRVPRLVGCERRGGGGQQWVSPQSVPGAMPRPTPVGRRPSARSRPLGAESVVAGGAVAQSRTAVDWWCECGWGAVTLFTFWMLGGMGFGSLRISRLNCRKSSTSLGHASAALHTCLSADVAGPSAGTSAAAQGEC
jgi:hypothetical protein